MESLHKSKVFIVEDHLQMRQGLRKLLEFERDFQVCGEAGDVPGAIQGILESRPDVAVVDLELGSRNGLEVIQELQRRSRQIPVLILSMHSETLYAESALYRGAQGYVMKTADPDEITYALRRVLEGDIYLSSAVRQCLHSRHEGTHE